MKKIIFTSNLDVLNDFPELHPQPAKNFIPKWYKDLSPRGDKDYPRANLINLARTVKTCPSYMDIFNEGWVLVSPCDIWITVKDDGYWEWKTSSSAFELKEHGDFQMIDHLPNKPIKKILKFNNPWHAITPKGYSIRQIPLLYHYENTDFFIPYGVIKTDKHHELNQQICFISDKEEILIKRGQPMNYIIPYKREKIKMVVEDYNLHYKKIDKSKMYVSSSFRSNYHRFD